MDQNKVWGRTWGEGIEQKYARWWSNSVSKSEKGVIKPF